ncbi:hypothetical protein BRD01_09365 [Halobacteriales archaeon QS_8_65_32]|nr:MAG: hypothetical protein BRD01_09365 [Halobacteriales archaeon QS_8_65_32]
MGSPVQPQPGCSLPLFTQGRRRRSLDRRIGAEEKPKTGKTEDRNRETESERRRVVHADGQPINRSPGRP